MQKFAIPEWLRKLAAGVAAFFARFGLWLAISAGALGIVALAGLLVAYLVLTPRTFNLAEIERANAIPGVTFYDTNGEVLAARGAYRGDDVRLKELPPYLPKAFIAVEDRRFYKHWGFSPRGILRAIWTNIRHGRAVQGGSTITQQLARNLFLSNDKTLNRKFKEFFYAIWLERHLTKDQILELYLNRIYFGAGTFGVDAASHFYFAKTARSVSLAEAAMLAGLPKSPSRLSPSASEKSLARASQRAAFVLEQMRKYGFIDQMMRAGTLTADDFKFAKECSARPTSRPLGIQYYLDYVYELVGTWRAAPEIQAQYPDLGNQDLVIRTTLDRSLQMKAEKAVAAIFAPPKKPAQPETTPPPDAAPDPCHRGPAAAEEPGENPELGPADRRRVGQAALVSIDAGGAIRAMVGGKNYIDSQFNRAVSAQRQPGSSFKPYVYLTALESGKFTPETVVDDAPITIDTPQGPWSPENYTGTYRGPVSVREAMAESLNTVAVRLSEAVGPKSVVETAHRLGIQSPLLEDHAIALGASELNLLEHTAALGAFQRNGLQLPIDPLTKVAAYTIEKIETKSGRVLFERPQTEMVRVIPDPLIATQMTNLMYGVIRIGTGRSASLGARPAAGKTGTSSDWRDAWFMGFTGQYVTGVWVGNDDNSQMDHVTGGSFPAQIWRTYMTAAHEGLPIVQMPGAQIMRSTAEATNLRDFYRDLADELAEESGAPLPPPTEEQPASAPPKKKCNWPWCR